MAGDRFGFGADDRFGVTLGHRFGDDPCEFRDREVTDQWDRSVVGALPGRAVAVSALLREERRSIESGGPGREGKEGESRRGGPERTHPTTVPPG